MPLTVETGAGVAAANSFVDLAAADVWFANANDTVWAALSVAQREQHLIRGTYYVSNQQIYPYSGAKSYFGNALAWPRTGAVYWYGGGAVPAATVPYEIIEGTIIAAGRSANGGLPTADTGATGGREVKRERIEGAVTIDYYHSSEGQADGSSDALGQAALTNYGDPNVTGVVIPLVREDALISQTAAATGGVTRAQAARRGTYFLPSSTPAAFGRGAFDMHPLAEDETYSARGYDT